jgi:hypothetical protein
LNIIYISPVGFPVQRESKQAKRLLARQYLVSEGREVEGYTGMNRVRCGLLRIKGRGR